MSSSGTVPRYFDAFLGAIARGATIDHVHLGHWDDPSHLTPASAREGFARAQARLAEQIVDRLEVAAGDRVLDVGCGFGGVTRLLGTRFSQAWLCGLNIDERQLKVAQAASPATSVWIAADACNLPFADSCFEHVVCVEAMFHFPDRGAFLREVARVLTLGGRIVLSDILVLRPDGADAATLARIEGFLRDDLGPWPNVWIAPDELEHLAAASGLAVVNMVDASAATMPSYHTIAPWSRPGVSGSTIMRDLHTNSHLRYVYYVLAKT